MVIEGVAPAVDDGRFPSKRVVGDVVSIEADVFADGHDLLDAVVHYRHESEGSTREVRMLPLVNDRWRAEITVDRLGSYLFTVEGWIDHYLTWHRDLKKRIAAAQPDLDVQLLIGLEMIRASAARASTRDRRRLETYLELLESDETLDDKLEEVQRDDLLALMWRNAERRFATHSDEYRIEVDRKRAAFSAWYELFPRSAAAEPGRHGTFADVEKQLPRIARMGFDVVYLPPIHPIGSSHRKGRNNAVAALKGDVGSPWAIGSERGGHTALHPELGTMQDFEHLIAATKTHGLELALDIAFQASPDHPWVREHPEWFRKRPDGSVQYAENPPKKYQDIYPIHFEGDAWQPLWNELRDVFRFWAERGVRVFRVDNPHTKPLPFWAWVIAEIKHEHPDAIFLSEAFTRPKIMYRLAKGGFSQSYNYFPWRNTKRELVEYFEEVTKPPVSDFFRPNAWPNTPDILPEYLQQSGRAGFIIRLTLAATLAASYGIYGPPFERAIGTPREAGSEEYLDSEKYEMKQWPDTEDDLSELIAVINRIRRENPALQQNETLRFHATDNEEVICYSKSAGENVVITVVTLDPHNPQAAWIDLDLEAIGLDSERTYQVHDLLSGARHAWHGPRNFVRLNPHVVPAHIFRIRRRVRSERDFEYFL